jgi:serine/threonine-protein kinase
MYQAVDQFWHRPRSPKAMGVQPSIRQIGQYQVLEILGQGGMGVVYRALDPAIGKIFAIKMLRSSCAEDPDLLERFYREARVTANLQHRNIVSVYALSHQNGKPYLVMDYLEGRSMSEIIASRSAKPLVDKLDLVIQICEGLQYAHERKLIHLDIKPANVIVLQDGTAKIVDFGIARAGGTQALSAGQVLASPYYMSPEQINAHPVDSRTDIFSTGVMLYELLTYMLPFKGDDATSTFIKILRDEPPALSHFLQEYPPELDDILKRALAKKVDDRYQTAEELGFDLLQVQKGLRHGMAIGLIERAEAAIRRGDLEKAKLDLQEVLKSDRQDDRANMLLRQVRQSIHQQQRAAQVVQMRSQATVTLAAEQYEEALALAEQAVRLDCQDSESIKLHNEIQQKISWHKTVRESLRKAESSLLAGDFDDAKAEVEHLLELDPSNAEGRALLGVVAKEQTERSRRVAVQGYVDTARRRISERKFSVAIDALREAEQIDPADSTVHELLEWALRGREKETRRNEIADLTAKIDGALRSEDFASAYTLCEIGLTQFPEEPTLLKLKSIASQRSLAKELR